MVGESTICYADDLCIVILSSAGLQQLLSICDQYCAIHSMTFNVKFDTHIIPPFFNCCTNAFIIFFNELAGVLT